MADPTAAVPHLLVLAHLAADHAAQRALRLPWAGQLTTVDAPQPAVPEFVKHSREQAEALLRRVGANPSGPSHADLYALVCGLPVLSPIHLRKSRVALDADWNGAKLRAGVWIDRLVAHAHQQASAPRPEPRPTGRPRRL